MVITLTENEISQAIAAFLGNSYTLNNVKFTVGRSGSGTRAEVDVSVVGYTATAVESIPCSSEVIGVPSSEPQRLFTPKEEE